MNKPIYLDYNATTPTDPAVIEAMEPYFYEQFGNPSSNNHPYGWEASSAVSAARKQVAKIIGADPKQILFTSGATESNNLALFGVLQRDLCEGKTPHLITSNIEHNAITEVAEMLQEMGAEVTFVEADKDGMIQPEAIEAAIRPSTKLISVMAANNEIGTINPIGKIGALAKEKGILFHTDAAQGVGKFEISADDMNIDFLSISGHKLYGPKGVGALYVKAPKSLNRVMGGGHQEGGLRPGTLNVPGIVGLGKACEMAEQTLNEEKSRVGALRDQLIDTILKEVPEARLNGHRTERLYNNASFSFHGLSADLFALGLSGLAVSSSSACSSGSAKPSHVLKAIGHTDELARSTVRMGLGRYTKPEHIELAIAKVKAMTEKNRNISMNH